MTNAQLLLKIKDKSCIAAGQTRELLDIVIRDNEMIKTKEMDRIRDIKNTLQEALSAATELDRIARSQTVISNE
jgi:hypothetical protein